MATVTQYLKKLQKLQVQISEIPCISADLRFMSFYSGDDLCKSVDLSITYHFDTNYCGKSCVSLDTKTICDYHEEKENKKQYKHYVELCNKILGFTADELESYAKTIVEDKE